MPVTRVLVAGISGAIGLGATGLVGLVAAVTGVGGLAPVTGTDTGASGGADVSRPSLSSVAPATVELYQLAATVCPGLSWTVLAAIGTVESDNGTSRAPGVQSGANAAGAEGPMQFEPATFSEYALPVPAGGASPPSPYDPEDAVYAAARMLCANGAAGDGDLPRALYAYNHSAAYVGEVLSLAEAYATEATGT